MNLNKENKTIQIVVSVSQRHMNVLANKMCNKDEMK